ncbi:unnamed protein product [Larinioides sclopetarius]|uniref:L-xylulose reductase n=1 Tax=Larinioides sclopetarius TaxID=280406 RepID=A0AAV2AEY4_9ARAC
MFSGKCALVTGAGRGIGRTLSIELTRHGAHVIALSRTMEHLITLKNEIVAEGMKERGNGGSIVNISSQAALVALPLHATYCASKGALDQLTKVMALELGPFQIRVNSVNPTVVMTEMGIKAWGEENKAKATKAKIPLGKFCEPEDVVKAVVFLLSDDARMITGVQLPIDGGYTTH